MSKKQRKNERQAKWWESAFGRDNLVSKELRRTNENIDRRKKKQFKHLSEIRSN
jgi:hypothetical protein